ncbi:hypothetical protein HAD_10355 [Hyphomonas adhaerens MHS-3]|uniref:Uncharacterized protein n=1 Tax=Hyphomonas adhaerens MHS-3 TaxID=1280949 RepID=A0A069E7P5_9PROT|nr:hypothetical protein HAD_10355 [Hyphomonas adhaerens MHS-3]
MGKACFRTRKWPQAIGTSFAQAPRALVLTVALSLAACHEPQTTNTVTTATTGSDTPTSQTDNAEPVAQANAPLVFLTDLSGRLENGQAVSAFMAPEFTFVYHVDNRCDGNTDGVLDALPASRVDGPFRLEVTNDGDGWACERKPVSKFEITFDLQKVLADWDRFEVYQHENDPYRESIEGRGVSDYLVVQLAGEEDELRIDRLEYRSEDPG